MTSSQMSHIPNLWEMCSADLMSDHFMAYNGIYMLRLLLMGKYLQNWSPSRHGILKCSSRNN